MSKAEKHPTPIELYQDWLEKKRACEALHEQLSEAVQAEQEAKRAIFNALAASAGDDGQHFDPFTLF